MNENSRYAIDKVRKASEKALTEAGLPPEDAATVVDSMLEADCRGVATHGVRMIPAYARKLQVGVFRVGTVNVLKSTSAFTTVDANSLVGAVSARQCVKIAVQGARKAGVHVVFAKNCNTFGPAFYFAEAIAKEGLIGLVFCNSPAAMPIYNGAEPMLGTNPFAFACPSRSEGMILFDMATSVTAKSKFSVALSNGEPLPDGWALDAEGNPTTDPMEAIKGMVLPVAGFKGYGLAMAIDILAGLLSGAGYLNRVNKFYSADNAGMNAGQLFIAIDPAQVYDGDFLTEMDCYIRLARSSKSAGDVPIVLPGDRGRERKQEAENIGISVDNATKSALHLGIFGGGEMTGECLAELRRMGFHVTLWPDEQATVPEPERYDAVICNGLFLYNEIKAFRNLKMIQLTSAGFDRVPLDYIEKSGIELRNAHGVYGVPMAEFALARILEFYKELDFFRRQQGRREWTKNRGLKELNGKTALILGCGDVGLSVAQRLRAFGVRITGISRSPCYSPYLDESRGAAELLQVAGNADILVCALPLTPETKGLLGREFFRLMKPGALFVNLSRGAVVREAELTEALLNNRLGGAVLDVFEREPLSPESPLWTLPNVLISPHNSFVGDGNQRRLEALILKNLKDWLRRNYETDTNA